MAWNTQSRIEMHAKDSWVRVDLSVRFDSSVFDNGGEKESPCAFLYAHSLSRSKRTSINKVKVQLGRANFP